MLVMCSESDITIEMAEKLYEQVKIEQELADIYSVVSNKFWWVEDNVYDYEEGTPAYKQACEITDRWGNLMECIELDIFDILKNEGVIISDKGRIVVLEPFMKRNGYFDSNGWWIKEQ